MRRAALAAICIAVVFIAPACRGNDASSNPSQQNDSNFVPVDPASTSPTDQAISKAQVRIRMNDKDDNARVDLAAAYLQKARETADPSLYIKAKGLLSDAKSTQDNQANFWITQGTLDLAEHKFSDGLTDGKHAVALDSQNEESFGVIVDADNELGDSDGALAATQKMLDLHPDLSALSRASYARELRGDLPGAIEAMTQAVTAGGTAGGENIAYVDTLLGGLLLTNGQPQDAENAYDAALIAFPDFGAAQAGQAQVMMAEERFDDAAKLLDQIIQRQPLEAYAVSRGDALTAAGELPASQRAYALVETINKLFVANGVNVDREAALFDADHHPGKDAVKQAKKALKSRGSLAGYDTLAWAEYTSGDINNAAKNSDKALSLGFKDPMERFHAAVIANAQKNTTKATQQMNILLATNPRFSGALLPQVKALAAQLNLPFPEKITVTN